MTVDGRTVGSIGPGLLILLGVALDDGEEEARYISSKTVNLRIFDDDFGKFDRSALDVTAELLIVSQFTLMGDTLKGRRPSFTHAAPPKRAEELFESTVRAFRESGLKVATGTFRANMAVSLVNDGPVTIILDSSDR